ncbi:hypothetical protein [Sulfurimonas sp.]|nr:hypothetical protein [Sulfurimonas sp.]MBW6488152.1 hypothetical protein [Sulfurimonas sp.]
MTSGIFLLLDDIAMLSDDVAVASKVATQKNSLFSPQFYRGSSCNNQ